MALYIPAKDDWAQVFEKVGKGVSEGYQQSADQRALQNAMSSLPPDATPRQIIDSFTGAKTYNNAAKQEAIKNYMGVAEFEEASQERKKRAAQQEIANTLAAAREGRGVKKEERAAAQEERNLARDEVKEAEKTARIEANQELVDQLPELSDAQRDYLKKNPDVAEDVIKKTVFGKQPGDTAFDAGLRKDASKEVSKISQDLSKLQSNTATLDEVERLSKDRGLFDAFVSKFYYTKDAKQLETMSALLLDPMIKIFNPTGVVAVSKLAFIRDLFQIKPTDTPNVIQGKLNTLRHYNKIAIDRGTKRRNLLMQYKGLVPPDELLQMDRESESILDAMQNTELHGVAIPEEQVKAQGLPDPGAQGVVGRTIVGPDGQRYRSDGSKWVKA